MKSFLALPPELRNEIYIHLFSTMTIVRDRSSPMSPPYRFSFKRARHPLAILQTCRACYAYLGYITLYIGDFKDLKMMLVITNPGRWAFKTKFASRIRHVAIVSREGSRYAAENAIRSLTLLPDLNLRTLTVRQTDHGLNCTTPGSVFTIFTKLLTMPGGWEELRYDVPSFGVKELRSTILILFALSRKLRASEEQLQKTPTSKRSKQDTGSGTSEKHFDVGLIWKQWNHTAEVNQINDRTTEVS